MNGNTGSPEVTIGLPFHGDNAAAFRLAVRSIFAQDSPDWTLLLVSDGAGQALVNAAKSIRDSRVTVFDDGLSKGLAARLNEIASRCTTPLLFRMDADDVMRPQRVRIQQEFLRNQEIDTICGSRVYVIDERDRIRGRLREGLIPRSSLGYLASNVLSHPSVAGHASAFKAHDYDTSVGRVEDKEYWIRIRESVRLVKLDETLLYYRIGSDPDRKKLVRTAVADDRLVFRNAWEWGGPVLALSRIPRMVARQALYRFGPLAILRWAADSHLELGSNPEMVEELARIRRQAVPGWGVDGSTDDI